MKTKLTLFFALSFSVWSLSTSYQTVSSKSDAPVADMIDYGNYYIDTVLHGDATSTDENNAGGQELVVEDAAPKIEAIILADRYKAQETSDDDIEVMVNGEKDFAVTANDLLTQEKNVVATASSSSSTESMSTQHNPHMYGMWIPPVQNVAGYPWLPSIFHPFFWMQAMMNPMVNSMTQPQSMDAMMRTMDPRLMFAMFGIPNITYDKNQVPDQLPVAKIPGFPTQSYQYWPKNTVSKNISREAKMNAFQTAMAMNPLSLRNMVSMMADKMPVSGDVSWNDAIEAMKLRANEVNLKFVGSSALWKEIEAVTEQPSARVEIFRFCDAAVARKILDEVPEFIVFLPCKIALVEDADGKLWVMTLDWDVSWMDFAQNPNSHLAKDLRADAKKIRENIRYIMEGAATGEF